MEGDVVVEDLVRTWTGWADALAFDDLIANRDRNAGNLLVGAPGEVWLIDHGKAFTGPAWRPEHLDPTVVTRNDIARELVPHIGLPERYRALRRATEMAELCKKLDITEVLKEAFVAAFASEEEISALRNFLLKRPQQLVRIVGIRLGLPVVIT